VRCWHERISSACMTFGRAPADLVQLGRFGADTHTGTPHEPRSTRLARSDEAGAPRRGPFNPVDHPLGEGQGGIGLPQPVTAAFLSRHRRDRGRAAPAPCRDDARQRSSAPDCSRRFFVTSNQTTAIATSMRRAPAFITAAMLHLFEARPVARRRRARPQRGPQPARHIAAAPAHGGNAFHRAGHHVVSPAPVSPESSSARATFENVQFLYFSICTDLRASVDAKLHRVFVSTLLPGLDPGHPSAGWRSRNSRRMQAAQGRERPRRLAFVMLPRSGLHARGHLSLSDRQQAHPRHRRPPQSATG
jgi:hypothetical protein